MRARKLTNKYRSLFIATARKLGFLDAGSARDAQFLVERAPDGEDTGDLLVDAGLLSREDARTVHQAQMTSTQGTLEALSSKFSRAGLAIKSATTAAEEVVRVTQLKKRESS